MTFDLAGGRRLLLAGGGQIGIWISAGAIALVLLLVLYRYERRLVSRPMGIGLLTLRVLAALALIAALCEPIAQQVFRESVRGRVIVGVDLSESMATADPGRSADDRRRLAQMLNLSPAEPPESLTRRDVARRLLQGRWLDRIKADHAVEAVGFARETVAASPEALVKALRRPARAGDPSALVTDWTPALEKALKEDAPGTAPVLGVVLVTDGRQNGAGDSSAVADRLAARGIPVFPVLVGSTVPPRDAAVAAVKAPEGVYKGDVASVEVTVKADGLPAGTEVPVTLDRPGATTMTQAVKATGDGTRPVATFRVPLDAVGPQALTVAVGPTEGDVRADNDRRTVTVQVADDKARVLLVDGEARWEFQYLRNALIRDPRVAVEAVLFHQPTSPANAGTTYPTSLPPRPENPKPDPLGTFDAIIVGDVELSSVTPETWARLESYVAERGGTLILSAGPKSWLSAQGGVETLRKLLPVIDPKVAPYDPNAVDPAHPSQPAGVMMAPTPTATADAWPMLQFAAEADRSRAIWAGLPGLPWVLIGKAKPGATVLASAVGVVGEDRDGAVIAVQPFGLGKVLWVGTDGTWRWRHRVGDAYHHRFWGQVVRWAASGKLTAGNRLVRFGPARPKADEGDGIKLTARFADEAPGVGPDLLVAARIFKAGKPGASATHAAEGEAVAVVPLRAAAGQPRTFEGTAPGLPQGAYVIRLDVPQLASAFAAEANGPPPEAVLEVTARETPERIELAATRDPLDRLASATGGQVLADHEADRLPPLLRRRTLQRTWTEETSLWDRPHALVLFFGLLTVEWLLRKRAGLP